MATDVRSDRRGDVVVAMVAAVTGLVTWTLTMADAPRYSFGPHQNNGNIAYFPVLLALALVGGFVRPRRARLIGALLGLPGLVLSPWTAPRGDNDGLWLLIVPALGVFVLVLVLTARVGARIRRWRRPAADAQPAP
jgi:peptidoglycan/LPS O-acetylase OafA/YrhL